MCSLTINDLPYINDGQKIGYNQVNIVVLITVFIIFVFTTPKLAFASEVYLVTEEYPPYSYVENNKVTGVSVEIVEAVTREVGSSYISAVYPWNRAYDMALHKKNTLIFSIIRTSEREKLFKWVDIIITGRFCLFYLKDRRDITSKSAKGLLSYNVGVIRGDIQGKYLLTQGFRYGENLNQVNQHQQIYKMLLSGRVDLWAATPLTVDYIAKQNGTNSNAILNTSFCYEDHFSEGAYMAFSDETSDELVNKFKDGLLRIKQNGAYKKILDRYSH